MPESVRKSWTSTHSLDFMVITSVLFGVSVYSTRNITSIRLRKLSSISTKETFSETVTWTEHWRTTLVFNHTMSKRLSKWNVNGRILTTRTSRASEFWLQRKEKPSVSKLVPKQTCMISNAWYLQKKSFHSSLKKIFLTQCHLPNFTIKMILSEFHMTSIVGQAMWNYTNQIFVYKQTSPKTRLLTMFLMRL